MSAVLVLGAPSAVSFAWAESHESQLAFGNVDQARREAKTPEDMAAVIRDFRILAQAGNPPAAFRLGDIYRRGTLVERDYPQAVIYLRQAADGGMDRAWPLLGKTLLRLGRGEEAFAAFEAAASTGAELDFDVGRAHLRGQFGEKSDPAVGVAILKDLAEEGDGRAAIEVARAYADPSTGFADFERSVALLEPLAEKNDPIALEQLARLYRSGAGVERSYPQANEFYLAAVEAGSTRALRYAAETEIRRGLWGQAKQTLERAVAADVPGAEIELAQGHIRNSFRQHSSKQEGTRILEEGIARGEISHVNAALGLLAEWRRFRADPQDLQQRAIAAADAGDGSAAAALLYFTRERPDLVRNAHVKRGEYLDRYEDILSEQTFVREKVYLTFDKNRNNPRTAWKETLAALEGLDEREYYDTLVAAARADRNAFVYVLQNKFRQEGSYRGSANGYLTRGTLRQLLRYCRENGFYDNCHSSPLGGQAIQLVSAAMARDQDAQN